MADTALGRFLRARREATTPSQVGLPTGPRRRTPGLRRAELAQLARLSVEYLTRLERGTDRHPSGHVLGALADTLGLTAEERAHLHRLVKAGSGEPCPQSIPTPRSVRSTVRALLDRLDPTPALVVDAHSDVLAHNTGFQLIAGPVGLLDADQPNLARFVFTDNRARTAFPDWEQLADKRAAALRAAADLGDHAAAALAEELSITAGLEFGHRYAASATLPAWTGVERWQHPSAGALRLAFEGLTFPGADEDRLITYLPADDATSDAIATLQPINVRIRQVG